MIRYKALGYIGGQFLLVFAASLLLPAGVGLYYWDSGLPALAISAGVVGLVAGLLGVGRGLGALVRGGLALVGGGVGAAGGFFFCDTRPPTPRRRPPTAAA